jgi:hypothetical protein
MVLGCLGLSRAPCVGLGFLVRLRFASRSLAVWRVCAIALGFVSGWRAFSSVSLCNSMYQYMVLSTWYSYHVQVHIRQGLDRPSTGRAASSERQRHPPWTPSTRHAVLQRDRRCRFENCCVSLCCSAAPCGYRGLCMCSVTTRQLCHCARTERRRSESSILTSRIILHVIMLQVGSLCFCTASQRTMCRIV